MALGDAAVSGKPPAGVVGDASVLNAEQGEAAFVQGAVYDEPLARSRSRRIIAQRLDPDVANIDNEVDKLVSERSAHRSR